MRHGLIVALVLFAAPAVADDQIDLGRAVAETHCASCHAIGSDDVSPHAEAIPFRDLSKRYPVDLLETAMVEGLFSSHDDMPTFVFDPENAEALIAYLESVQNQ